MSYGKMNTFINLVEKQIIKDSEGFSTETDIVLASARAYQEGRHGNGNEQIALNSLKQLTLFLLSLYTRRQRHR